MPVVVPVTALWLPIVLSSVAVFIASSIVHMVIQWHNPDYKKLPNEDEVCAALKKGNVPPGQYVFPHMLERDKTQDPAAQKLAMQKRFEEGPVGVLYIKLCGPLQLGPFLGKWVAYTLVVGLLVAYLAHVTLLQGESYNHVFRVVALGAWLAYAWQGPSDSIWKGKPWMVTFRGLADGLLYALLTAGVFAWLWPR